MHLPRLREAHPVHARNFVVDECRPDGTLFQRAAQRRGLQAHALRIVILEDLQRVLVVVVDDDAAEDGRFAVEDVVVERGDGVGFVLGFEGEEGAVEEDEAWEGKVRLAGWMRRLYERKGEGGDIRS